MNTQIVSYQARQAIQIGRMHHWRFRVVGTGEVPTQPFYKEEWVYVPVKKPEMGQDRLQALISRGIRIKGFVIAHEAPRLLSAPASKPKNANTTSVGILPETQTVIDNLVSGMLLFFSLVFQVVLLDPALIVVLDDGTWLEVMSWYE